jgi:hypothetical protein
MKDEAMAEPEHTDPEWPPAEFARKRHGDQKRKGTNLPYFTHPAGVAHILERLYPGRPDLIAAGWLHDILEDTPTRPEELEARFGLEVRRLVEAVTKQDGEYRPPTDVEAMRLKAADALDNVTFTVEGLRRGELVFKLFKSGVAKVDYWRSIADHAAELLGSEPLVHELTAAVDEVETLRLRLGTPGGVTPS